MKILIAAIAGSLWLTATAATAHEYKAGTLEIIHPHARATPPKARVGAGYMRITNSGTEPDRLMGGSADFAEKVEVHVTKMDGDVMKMRRVEGGLEIPAGGEVVLKPGSYHIMFMKLKEQLVTGEKRPATLQFQKAGPVEVVFSVEDIKATGKTDHGKMDHSGHGNGHAPQTD